MGQSQHTPSVKLLGRRLRPRTCLRKGCGRRFQPVRWNQRYCQDPACLRLVRRWQAAKRQRLHRQSAANRQRHADAEAQRRHRARSAIADQEEATAKSRETATPAGAWSRSKTIPRDFCDRPGCYEPLPADSRAPARYCGPDCGQVMRRVLDRERKWLFRNRYHRRSHCRGDSTASRRQPMSHLRSTSQASARTAADPVRDYRDTNQQTLSSSRLENHDPRRSVKDDHSKASVDRRSRPPPSG